MKKFLLFLVILVSTLTYYSCQSKSTGSEIVGKWVPCSNNDPDQCTIIKQNDGTFKGNVKFDDYRNVDFFLEMKEDGHFAGVGSAFTLIYKTPPEHIFLHVPGTGSYHDLDLEFCKPK